MNLKWLVIPVSTLLAALIMHSAPINRYTDTSSDKAPVLISGPRTQLADNYFYFTLLKHVPERFDSAPTDSHDPDGGDYRHVNSISASYAPALYAGYFIYKISTFITSSSREALLLTSIINTWIFATCVVVFIATLLNESKNLTFGMTFLLALVSMIYVDSFSLSAYYGNIYWNRSLLLNEPNSVRMINPTLFWSVGLLSATYILRWLRGGRNTDLALSIGATCLCGLFSVSVGATIVGAIGLTIAVNIFRYRDFPLKLTIIFSFGSSAIIWTLLQLSAYATTPLGMDLRHGQFVQLIFNPQFLLFLIFIPILKRWLIDDSKFITSLLVMSIAIALVCDSFNLGSRLWLRGGAIFVWSISLFVIIRAMHFSIGYVNDIVRRLVKAIFIIIIPIFVIYSQYLGANSWVGFIHRDKAELYDWMAVNLRLNSIVISEDIDDAYLIPVYTNSKSLFSSVGMTSRTVDDELKRYFFATNLYRPDHDVVKQISEIVDGDVTEYYEHIFSQASPHIYSGQKEDAVLLLRNIIYFPYIDRFNNILNGQSRHEEFVETIKKLAFEGRNEQYKFEYIIVNKNGQRPKDFEKLKVIYYNDSYELLANQN